MKKEIEIFFKKTFDYENGLKILLTFCPSHVLIDPLSKGFSMSNKQRLISTLKNLKISEIKAEPNYTDLSSKIIRKLPIVSTPLLPIIVKNDASFDSKISDLNKRKALLINQATHARIEIQSLNLNLKQRGLNAQRIVECFDELGEIWDALDYYDEFGTLPIKYSKEVNVAQQAISNMHRIQNLRTYISKDKKKLVLAKKSETKVKLETRLNEMNLELKMLINAH